MTDFSNQQCQTGFIQYIKDWGVDKKKGLAENQFTWLTREAKDTAYIEFVFHGLSTLDHQHVQQMFHVDIVISWERTPK